MQENMVSEATLKNWSRLGVDVEEQGKRLSSRANKRLSKKNILPLEYFSNKENIQSLIVIADYIKENGIPIRKVIYNLALNLLKENNLIELRDKDFSSKNKYLAEILSDFKQDFDKYLLDVYLPLDEEDFLGIVYQYSQSEGDKNTKGSYYTPQKVIQKVLKCLRPDDTFLDPCCGTGSFILQCAQIIKNPQNIYGCDLDEIACFIAKINLIIKFKNIEFCPNIYNINFLGENIPLEEKYFDVISTNPPWGAYVEDKDQKLFPKIKSGESFAYFIVQSKKYLKNNGKCSFILPESILNVKVHQDIRKFILDGFSIRKIENLGKIFSGVLSNVVMLELNGENIELIELVENGKTSYIEQKYYKSNNNYNFSFINSEDARLLDKIYSTGYETLINSVWGLGIVTGNNKKYLSLKKTSDNEPIYTGKEICAYYLQPAKNFIEYKRENFQQAAKDEIYRCEEKLVYKFISKKLVFAYDDSKSLFLNSANILIPRMETHSTKTAMAFLNSKLFRYLYLKKFNELKVLKNNLSSLPFPILTPAQKCELEKLVNNYLETQDSKILYSIDKFVFECFSLTPNEIDLINDFCN
ncbi:N-6 DNA methylase [bacterium]|nr:N-6 DNA methylase [bacterium]